MTSWTRLEIGAYAAGGGYSLGIFPKYWKFDQSKMGVIYVHGWGGDAFECRDYVGRTGAYNIIDAIAEAGFPVISCDIGGNAWGSDACIALIDAARNYLQTTFGAKPGKVAIVGQSMGHVSAMAYTAANRAKVACVAGIIPVSNLSDIYGQAQYTPSINTAYGGAYSEATYGATHNPQTMAVLGKFAGLPWMSWAIQDDTVAIYSADQTVANWIGATATLVALPGTGGHSVGTVAKIPPADVVAFITANQT